MANEAVRDVTIRVNVVAGNIEKQDMSWLSVAREDATKVAQSMQSIVTSQKDLAKSQEIVKQATNEVADAQKAAVDEVRKSTVEVIRAQQQSAKELRMITEDRARHHREALEIMERNEKEQEERRLAREKKRQESYDNTKKFDTPENNAAHEERVKRTTLTEPGEVNIARQQKDQAAADAAAKKQADELAAALRARHEEAEAERTAISEREGAKRAKQAEKDAEKVAREQERIADRAEAAARRLPHAWNQVTGGMMASGAAAVKLGLNLAMLTDNGSKDTEELAKKFVDLQAKIGLVTETKSLFTGIGKTLNDLQRAGELTQSLVAGQQALGVATTASQAATMRLAGAAAVAQAAMAPIAIGVTAAVAVLLTAKVIMDAIGDSAEEAAKQQEYQAQKVETFNQRLEKTIGYLERERALLETQKGLIKDKFDIQQMLDGKTITTPGNLKKENEELTKQNSLALDNQIDQSVAGVQKTISTPQVNRARTLLEEEAKLNNEMEALDKERQKYKNAGIDTADVDAAILAKETQRGANIFEQNQIRQDTGTKGKLEDLLVLPDLLAQIKKTEVDQGLIKDMPTLLGQLKQLPEDLRKQFLQGVQSQVSKQKETDVATYTEAEQSIETAKSKKKEIEAKVLAENERFRKEEDTAARYGGEKGKRAGDQALDYLDKFDRAKNVDDKQRLADQSRKALERGGVLTEDMDKLLRGANTDSGKAREQLKDDKVVDTAERRKTDEEIKKLTDASIEAQNVIDTAPRLVKSLTEKLKEISRQQEELRQAIENRD